jgi:hypothetical protein
MRDKDIYSKIEEIYKSEKGKGFITHLIRSFLPVSRTYFMLVNEKKRSMKCAITGTPLISKQEVVSFQIDNIHEVIKNLKDRVLGNTETNLVADNFKGKALALECENSDKLLCADALQQLLNFTSTEYLKGNKRIGYIIKDEMIKDASNHFKLDDGERKLIKKASKPQNKRATFSLSEIEALKNLKDKIEKTKN